MNTSAEQVLESAHATLGAALRAAREQRGLSLHQAAQDMHIGDTILEALERGTYAEIGAPIFVRGHLRNYARLLGLNEDETLTRYEHETGKPTVPTLVTQRQDSRVRHVSTAAVSVLVVIALCVLAVVWWMHREPVGSGSQATATPSATVQPVTATPAATSVTTAAASVPVAVAKDAPPEAAATPHRRVSHEIALPPAREHATHKSVTPTSVTANSGGTVVGLAHVQFILDQASWIEVYDVNGKRLFYDLATAGQQVNVTGAGPLQVFLGNAPGVSVLFNGSKFDLTTYTRSDHTARFRLGAPPASTQPG